MSYPQRGNPKAEEQAAKAISLKGLPSREKLKAECEKENVLSVQ
jgi:hypothetical protein